MRISFLCRSLGFACLVYTQAAIAAPDHLAVTIYTDNLALVQDSRTLDLKAGRQRIEFKNVSAQIRPETVSLNAAGIGIFEQNFDFDLLSPAKMMEKAVGHTVTIVRVNPATGAETRQQAFVLSTNNGVVLKIGDQIEVLRDDGLPTRVVFDKVPDNLRAEPTLSITLNADQSGAHPATLSYLTPGLGWRADYVALYDETNSKIDVQGWVTLTNSSGTTFAQADTVLVAGQPNTIDNPVEPQQQPWQQQRRSTLAQAGTESGGRARLGDYYLYPLPEPTTIANQQTKQVSFLDVHAAPATHGYEYRLGWMQTIEQPASAKSIYRFSNSAKAGLGDQLPAGIIRFYLRDKKGSPQFIGESKIDHTPMGSELSLATGDAFDVKVQSTVENRTAINLFRWKTTMHYKLSNALPKAVVVNLVQDGLWGDTRIVAESQKSQRRSADTAEWTVSVPANGKAELNVTFDSKY